MKSPKRQLPKIRRTWGNLRPVTKVKPSKKLYERRRAIESDFEPLRSWPPMD